MAKSKSGSGSIVKSVESMLPKGISLMHVILAIALGLLICSFMNDSKVVEGLDGECGWDALSNPTVSVAFKTRGENACKAKNNTSKDACEVVSDCIWEGDVKSYRLGDGCTDGDSEFIGRKDDETGKTLTCKGGKLVDAAVTTATSGGDETTPGGNDGPPAPATAWSLSKSKKDAKSGMCIPVEHKGTAQYRAICSKKADKSGCDDVDEDCRWVACDKDYTGPYLKGKDHNDLARCMGGSDVLPTTFPWETDTSKLEIIDGLTKDDKHKKRVNDLSWNNTANSKNFLQVAGCKKDDDGRINCAGSNFLSKNARDTVEAQAKNCRNGWDAPGWEGAYKDNGNGPIMSFTKNEGLKCLNPFYDTVELPISEPRMVESDSCPKDKATGKVVCPCNSHADLIYDNKDKTWVEKNVLRHVMDWGPGERCNNKAYQDSNPDHFCAPTHTATLGKDLIKNSVPHHRDHRHTNTAQGHAEARARQS